MFTDASFTAAKARLDVVLPGLGRDYAQRRNHDLGAADRSNVSALSPWIRNGVISERVVLETVLSVHSPADAGAFVSEVFWRSYFKGWLEHRPGVWEAYRTDVRALTSRLEQDAALRRDWQAAVSGTTGIDAFDHWARELVETGYLHNHARMWFASIWIFTLNLPWQLGADFFLRQLIDGDPASNTCSWRWVAGLHTQGKHYLARAENIARFTEGRFNPVGQLNESAAALEESRHFDPVPLAWPDAVPLTGRAGLLLTCDSHDEGWPAAEPPASVLALAVPALRSPGRVSDAVIAFEQAALVGRADMFGHRARPVGLARDTAGVLELVCNWVRAEALETVVLPYTTIGPVRDLVPDLVASLREAGVSISLPTRRHDRLSWPHASKGFFKLKREIPGILEAMGQTP
jgi:deoxyribodipyrimidine photo-lyase